MVNRIRELLEVRQLSPTQFADFIGVGRPVISHILSGRNEPSLKVVRSIIDAFPDVSLSWIISGEGPMLKDATPTQASSQAVEPALITPLFKAAPAPPVVPAPLVGSNSVAAFAPATPPPAPVFAAAPTSQPLPTAIRAPATPNQQLPQPPKFRTQAKQAPTPTLEQAVLAPTPTITAPESTPLPLPASPILPASTPTVADVVISAPVVEFNGPASNNLAAPAGAAETTATPAQMPIQAPIPYSPSPESPATPVSTSTPVAASVAASSVAAGLVLPPNPAAAFSFLGEAGKTIRRIVLFYNDGSFSDYRPEG